MKLFILMSSIGFIGSFYTAFAQSAQLPLLMVSEITPPTALTPQVEFKCSIDLQGNLQTHKITGSEENPESIKTENLKKIKLSASEIAGIKNDLTHIKDSSLTVVGTSCRKGDFVFQGLNPDHNEMMDLFAARNCTEVVVNTRYETQSLIVSMRNWCNLKMNPEIVVPKVPDRSY